MFTLQNAAFTCCFDDCGNLRTISRGALTVPFAGHAFDFGCQEQMATGLLEYESMLNFRTWNLPDIRPTGKGFGLRPESVSQDGNGLSILYHLPDTQVQLTYTLLPQFLKADMTITNTAGSVLYLNACALETRLEGSNVTFDFPGNAPISHYHSAGLKENEPVQTGLINFAVHTALAQGHMNLMFIDTTEKWGCGVYRSGRNTHYVFDAGLEMDLQPGQSVTIGSLYLSVMEQGNPYLAIREQVAALGYEATGEGIFDGVMYSCHPSGTMDSQFPLKDDLYQYAGYLDDLKAMGVDHVWLLPVFDHNEDGVYHSNDQSIIDKRYGGEEGCKYYCDKAHDLGMTILFDYVPHGPAPEFPVARDNPQWPSKRRDGSLQDEWECVSMDYNHPGYQEYTAELVHDHVRRFGVDGARIDCAMGGLSNWRPYADNRPSGNSVLAGVHITEAIRNGFLRGGKQSFILPENFNLIPNYYHCTDLFYGMNLYRAFVELEQLLPTDPAQYAARLTDFLEREMWITPENLHKLRFLGNHDTVSWVWQCGRAADIYGVGGAKALFALISLIDGMPMIYQGDEDPTICLRDTENLTAFFTRLFADRKRFIPKGNRIEYLHTGSPIFAFRRLPGKSSGSAWETQGTENVLVLINLSTEPQAVPAEAASLPILAGDQANADLLAPFSYRILKEQ